MAKINWILSPEHHGLPQRVSSLSILGKQPLKVKRPV